MRGGNETKGKEMKERSFMLGIPLNEEDITDPDLVVERLKAAEGIQVRTDLLEDGKIMIQADCLGDTYMMEVWAEEFAIPEFYRVQHFFPDVDFEAIRTAKVALVTSMEFGDDPLASYHAQLKFIEAMLPDKLAVLDESSEKLLSPLWVTLAANSHIHPSPNYIFTVQAVGGDQEQVWLHTHGLNRCGIPELEILDANTENYQSQYHAIVNAASRLLEMEMPEPKEPLYLGRLSETVDLVVTFVPWEEAVEAYAPDKLGGKLDRRESHNGNSCVIYIYPTYEDYENKNYQSLSLFDEILAENPLYWLSNQETDRMKALALERVEYMKKAFADKDNQILVKVGLVVDPEHRSEENEKEHIWFELLSINDTGFQASLTQEPYFIEGLHEGAIRDCAYEEITDWLIFAPQARISPDDVYLLEGMPTRFNDELN